MTASKDSVIAWQDSFALGLPEIDDQHKALFSLMNRLWSALVLKAGAEELLEIIGELEHYTISHFAAEETFMRVTRYPRFLEHKQAHDKFVERLALEKSNLAGGKVIGIALLHFLKDWLVNHILIQDKAYAEEYQSAKSPTWALGKFFRSLWS